jgi:hypothetical protein
MNGRYILVGQTPVPEPNLETWAIWFETADRIVARDEVGASLVSTVFLGLDHSFGKGPPILFETMVFTDGDGGADERRCSTWAEAETQHREVVEQLKRWRNASSNGSIRKSEQPRRTPI